MPYKSKRKKLEWQRKDRTRKRKDGFRLTWLKRPPKRPPSRLKKPPSHARAPKFLSRNVRKRAEIGKHSASIRRSLK